jgi:isopenicillin-N epimerase
MQENPWLIPDNIYFLNHGSYGATPRVVLDYQQQLREQMERQPLAFLGRELEGLLDTARKKLADLVLVKSDDLVFIPNATTAVNAVLNSLTFQENEEILITDQTYNACANAVKYIAQRWGVKVIIAQIPFPVQSSSEITQAILEKISLRTKLVVLDHVTSPTALIWPIKSIVKELNNLGIDTLIDGAHALGFLPLDISAINPTYYTANCHKWLSSPKGAAFLYVRADKQEIIRPLTISHGANSPRQDRSRFQLEFAWMGTDDPTAYLSVPKAIEFLNSLSLDGLRGLMQMNSNLALKAKNLLCNAFEVNYPCPESMIGAMASILIPSHSWPAEELYKQLWSKYQIEVPIIPWGEEKIIVRISAHYYNSIEQYEYLAKVLNHLLLKEKRL